MNSAEYKYLAKLAKQYPKGDILVAGTERGDDVRTFQGACPGRNIIVIDSFLGLAPPVEEDKEQGINTMEEGECNIGGLEAYLDIFKDLGKTPPKEIYPMWITRKALWTVPRRPLGIIFLDLDHYAPTKACLTHFVPWLIKPGVILVHDYDFVRCPGTKKCCNEHASGWTKIKDTGFGQLLVG